MKEHTQYGTFRNKTIKVPTGKFVVNVGDYEWKHSVSAGYRETRDVVDPMPTYAFSSGEVSNRRDAPEHSHPAANLLRWEETLRIIADDLERRVRRS